jgi:hypothetical protein
MGLTRQERLLIHKKIESRVIVKDQPSVEELSEGVPTFRVTDEGLVLYIKHDTVLYKVVLTEVLGESRGKYWEEYK